MAGKIYGISFQSLDKAFTDRLEEYQVSVCKTAEIKSRAKKQIAALESLVESIQNGNASGSILAEDVVRMAEYQKQIADLKEQMKVAIEKEAKFTFSDAEIQLGKKLARQSENNRYYRAALEEYFARYGAKKLPDQFISFVIRECHSCKMASVKSLVKTGDLTTNRSGKATARLFLARMVTLMHEMGMRKYLFADDIKQMYGDTVKLNGLTYDAKTM